jgi:hypothetical protein
VITHSLEHFTENQVDEPQALAPHGSFKPFHL